MSDPYIERALSELATAILRQEYCKDVHNIPMLEALRDQEPETFKAAWVSYYGADAWT